MTAFSELLVKSVSDLRADYQSLAREEMSLRFQHAGKQLKNTSLLRSVRCRKARVKTALRVLLKKEG